MVQEKVKIRTYRSGDEIRIDKLFYEIFGRHRPLKTWEWQFKDNPQGDSWIMLAEEGGAVVGQYAFRRNDINFLGRELIAGQTCDVMVSPAHREQGLLKELSSACWNYAHENGFNLLFGFPNRNSYPGLMRNGERHRIANLKTYYFRMGFRKAVGSFPDWILKIFAGILCWIKLKTYKILLKER